MGRKHARIAVLLAALCVLPATWALARQPAATPSEEEAAIERFCGDQHPCVIVNGAAGRGPEETPPQLTTAGQALAQSGKPPHACPKAQAAYRAIGIDPDAFVGPCPEGPVTDRDPPEAAARAQANTAAALAARGTEDDAP